MKCSDKKKHFEHVNCKIENNKVWISVQNIIQRFLSNWMHFHCEHKNRNAIVIAFDENYC